MPIDVKASDLGQQVQRFREAIATQGRRAVELGRELHALLLDPLQAVLAKKTRLVVVPDAFLWSLPFEALPTPAGRYLVEDGGHLVRAVADGPRLALEGGSDRDAAARRSLVAFGKPGLGKAVRGTPALVRPAGPTAAAGGTSASCQEHRRPGPARREARSTSATQARADRLAQGVAPGTMLHLAVPVVLTEATPLYSLLAFTPTDSADAGHRADRDRRADGMGAARRGGGGHPRRVRARLG